MSEEYYWPAIHFLVGHEAPPMSDRQDRLDERISELEGTLREIRDELQPPRRGRSGLRPPTPGEMLRLTREYAIPAAIATLEAQIKALELLAELLGAVNIRDRESLDVGSPTDRAVDVGRTTLRRVRESLDRLEREMAAGGLPDDPAARDLLAEAKALQEDIDARLAQVGDVDGPESYGNTQSTGQDGVRIDVESELETIKDQVEGGEADDEGDGSE